MPALGSILSTVADPKQQIFQDCECIFHKQYIATAQIAVYNSIGVEICQCLGNIMADVDH